MRFYTFDSILHYSIYVNYFKYYCLNICCKFPDNEIASDFLKLISNVLHANLYIVYNNVNTKNVVTQKIDTYHYSFYHH